MLDAKQKIVNIRIIHSAKFNHMKEGTGRGRFLCKLLTTADFCDK